MADTPVIKITRTTWQKDSEALSAIRTKVFVEEQEIDPEYEWEEIDLTSPHFLIYIDDKPAGCARVVLLDDVGKVCRVAILKEHRGSGLATLLMEDVIAYAREHSLSMLKLDAQTYIQKLYERVGFEQTGPEFLEEGTDIPHIPMKMSLKRKE